mmetsp:Transcript_10334/g.24825  ORF Transcript_10334/g.24825 Transcript_10334/m.24825 type:complete len:430 (+) Transcript_10334:216-1505(+)
MSAMAAAASVTARFAGVCSVSGRCDAPAGGAASRAARGAARMGARHGKSSRTNGGIGANLRLRNDDRASPSTVVAAVMESGSPSTSTYQRRPEDVVASNGREVEQFALEACVARQKSGILVPPPRVPQAMLDAAYERCDEVTGEYAKTFYLGTKLMTPEKQRAIWAIYVWCRRTDELVDGPNASHITPEALDQWENRLEAIFEGRPADIIDAALCDTLSRFPVDIQPFRDMVDGMRMDLVKPRYRTFDELYEYCYRVAGTVGLMSMPIMGCDENFKGDLTKVYKAALSLGLANQLTNILRDVGEDVQTRNRIYIPLDELAEFGIEEGEIVRGGLYSPITGKVDDRWKAFMKFQIARAREVFAEAEAGVNCLHADARWPVWSALDVYRNILDAIEENDYDNFSQRAYVPKMKKLMMLPTAYMKAQKADTM